MSRCKCSKSDVRMNEQCPPYLEDITTRMEERRCDLIGRQRYLRDKITTMERSIPALMAYNMWMAGQKCEDAPYCKVREIMKTFSPNSDPTEKLLENLKKTVKDLNGETADLHEKIINADVKLEETGMELESLELANKEMNDTLNDLEKEVRSYSTPSLHSIHSEDLTCLTKIRQLANEELSLKNRIKELEKKEAMFREHMDRLLTSRECNSVCGRRRMMKRVQDLECNDKRMHCPLQMHKQNIHHAKKNLGSKENGVAQSDANVSTTSEKSVKNEQEQNVAKEKPQDTKEKKSSWISNWWKSSEKITEPPSETKTVQNSAILIPENNETIKSEKDSVVKKVNSTKPPKSWRSEFTTSSCSPCGHSVCPPVPPVKAPLCPRSYCVAPNHRSPVNKSCGGKYIPTCNVPCKKLFSGFNKSKVLRSRNPFCEIPLCVTTDHGIRQICKLSAMSPPAPCDFGSPCEICPSTFYKECLPPHALTSCRCNCRGKCARGLSDAPCNCSDEPLPPGDKGYQPTAPKSLNIDSHTEDSNSEDEFCECCSCGCEDSDVSLSCNCN